jgi:hypothetical protein
MYLSRPFRSLAFIAFVFVSSLSIAAQGDPTAIQQKLNAQFKLTTVTADRSDIVTAGDIVVLHKPGLVMYAVNSPMPPSNTYKNGKIGQGWGGFGKDLAIGMRSTDGTTAADYPHRTFVPEEKCWVTAVQVQKDGIVFTLFSDPYNDTRYYASLKIPFADKKQVPSVDAALQSVADVITVAPGDNASVQPTPPSPASAPAPAQSASSMTAIAPPPPPADAPPPTISIGQTRDQVTSAFGQPLREANLGSKHILYYKDMKVTLKDGKVTDVE